MDDDFDPLLETGRAVAKSLDGQPIKCPHCSEEFRIRPVAAFAAQDLIFNIKYEGDSISAQTIGGVILNMDKLLRSIANDIGVKALVFLKRVEQGDKEMSFTFHVAAAKAPDVHTKPAKPAQVRADVHRKAGKVKRGTK